MEKTGNQNIEKPRGAEAYELIKRLVLNDVGDFKNQYIVAFAAMAVVAAMTAASAYIIRDIVNEVFINRDMAMVWLIAGAVFTIFVVKGLAAFVQTYILARIGNQLVARNQKRIFNHMLTLGMDYYSDNNSSDLVTRISHNAEAARQVLNTIVTRVGRDALSLIGLVAVMVFQNPLLSAIALVGMPVAVIGIVYLSKRVKGAAKKQFVSLTEIVSALQETAQGISVVKAFNMETAMKQRMNAAVDDAANQANKIATITARSAPIMETLGGVAIACVILYGGFEVISRGTDPGSFFSFITALLLAYEPAKRLARVNVELSTWLVGVKLMFDLLDTPSTQINKTDTALDVVKGTVELNEVSFTYPKAREGEVGGLLKDLSLTFNAGETTALVGPSGAGKSTLLALLLRFYDPQLGTISVDGTDTRDVSLASLRSAIAHVSQNTFLFEGSVRDNILVGKPDASQEEMIAAARDANAHEFILDLPEGYDTKLGEHGSDLSGGQRQRIAIARALLKNAPIVLLDEATSALDSETEREIQAAFDRLMEGRTTIVIAHRLSTILHADKIVVMENGKVVEYGKHEELLANDALYARLYHVQFSDEKIAAFPKSR